MFEGIRTRQLRDSILTGTDYSEPVQRANGLVNDRHLFTR
jgi:hypothetical protein